LGIPPFVNNIDLASGDWSNFEFDASHVFFHHHHVTMGAELRDDYRQHQVNYNQQPYTLFLDNTFGQKDAAYYVQDNFTLSKKLILVGAVRSDWYEQFGTTYSPRAGLIFTPKDGTRIKLMYNKAFRAPNRFEQFYVSNNTDEANPLLQPERMVSYEVEVDENLTKDLHLIVDGFANDMGRIIDPDLNPTTSRIEYQNADYQDTRGLEVELRGKWGKGIEGNASYSFQNSRDPQLGDIVNSPHNMGKSQFSFPIYRQKFIASFEGQYTSRMSTLAGPVVGGYGVVNATLLARRLTRNLDFSFTGMNLFDKRYAVSGGLEHQEVAIEQDGRSVRAKLTYRFPSR
jgi:iron complex outermembrane receptor protein